MSRGRRTLLVLLMFAGLLGLDPGRAGAGSVEDQRRKADRIAEQLERLGDEATSLADQYETTQAKLAELQVEVAASEVRVAELEQRLGVVQSQVGELAMQTFVSGDQAGGLGELLVDSSAITTAVERDQYTRLALSAGQSTTDELDSTLNDLNNERERLASRQEQAQQLSEDLVERQQAVEAKTAETQQLKQQAEAELGQLIAEAAARRAAAEEAAARASRPPSSGGGSSSSGGGSSGGGSSGGESSGGDAAAPAPRAGSSIPAPSPGAAGAVSAAMSQIGVAYRYAAAEPSVAFDCSGLTMWAWAQAGVRLPHYSKAQFESLPHVPADQAQPGDLIFYKNPVGHVAMYIGGGQMIHAPRTGETVKVVAVNWGKVRDGIVGRPG
ncbi:MAG: NlpC/P60 family protein [Acidimicrobiia bacterium]